jgi:UDP-N-acetylmuramate dehydrogenase
VELEQRFVRLRALDPGRGRVYTFDRAACRFGYRDSRFKHGDDAALIIMDLTLRLQRSAPPALDYPDLTLELARLGADRPTASQVAEAVIRVRRRKLPDPRVVGNVGSFFKNPLVAVEELARLSGRLPGLGSYPAGRLRVKISAAQLIDACGWKGHRAGPVAVWHRHALVLCNRGGATGQDVLALSEDIRRDVAGRFGVTLELEPRVIGQD